MGQPSQPSHAGEAPPLRPLSLSRGGNGARGAQRWVCGSQALILAGHPREPRSPQARQQGGPAGPERAPRPSQSRRYGPDLCWRRASGPAARAWEAEAGNMGCGNDGPMWPRVLGDARCGLHAVGAITLPAWTLHLHITWPGHESYLGKEPLAPAHDPPSLLSCPCPTSHHSGGPCCL